MAVIFMKNRVLQRVNWKMLNLCRNGVAARAATQMQASRSAVAAGSPAHDRSQ